MKMQKLANERIFDFVITQPTVVDKEGEVVPESEIEEALDRWLINGAPITMEHSNKVVGRGIRWWKGEYKGKPAYIGRARIFKDSKVADMAWEAIKQGKYKAVSIGGVSFKPEDLKNGVRELRDLEILEVALCEEGMHPNADILDYNEVAKADEAHFFIKADIKKDGLGENGVPRRGRPKTEEERRETHRELYGNEELPERGSGIEKKVVKRGNKWCVIHCHGPDAGKPIKCFDTKEEAEAMHRAIMANKSAEGEEIMDAQEYYEKMFTKDDRPPKEWWDRCIARASKWATDPAKVCGALWFDPGRWPHGAGPAMRESYGKNVEGGMAMKKDVKKQEEAPEEEPKPTEEEKPETTASLEERVAALESAVNAIEEKVNELIAAKEQVVEEAKKEVSPDSTEDKQEVGEAAKPEEDKGEGKKLDEVAKQIKEEIMQEIKKSFDFKASTPRPLAENKETEIDAYEILKSGKPFDLGLIHELEAKREEEEIRKILGK